MPGIETLLAFALASAVLVAVPGPTVALVVSRSLASRQSQVMPLTGGVALGDLVATSLSLAGVGALLAASATAFAIVKWLGALYLVWIAVKLWRAPLALEGAEPSAESGAGGGGDRGERRRAFRDAFLVTVSNPKGIVFFVAFVPQFIDPGMAYLPQAITFVLLFTAIGAANVVVYALAADRLRAVISRPRTLRAMSRAGAAAIGAAGVATLLAARP